jgi:hypothetical protein
METRIEVFARFNDAFHLGWYDTCTRAAYSTGFSAKFFDAIEVRSQCPEWQLPKGGTK